MKEAYTTALVVVLLLLIVAIFGVIVIALKGANFQARLRTKHWLNQKNYN